MNQSYSLKKNLTFISMLIWVCLLAVHIAVTAAAGLSVYFRILIMSVMTVVSIVRIKRFDAEFPEGKTGIISAIAGTVIFISMFFSFKVSYIECRMPFQYKNALKYMSWKGIHTDCFPDFLPENISDFSFSYGYGYMDAPDVTTLLFTADDEWITRAETEAEKKAVYSSDIKTFKEESRNSNNEIKTENTTAFRISSYIPWHKFDEYAGDGMILFIPTDYEDLTYNSPDAECIFISHQDNKIMYVALS